MPLRYAFSVIGLSAAVLAAIPLLALDSNKAIRQLTHTSWSVNEGIPGPVTAIAQTRDGYLWFGTHAGLYRFDGQKFSFWEAIGSGSRLPRSAIASLLAARDGSLWVGFKANGISRLQGGAVKNYTPAEGLHAGGVLSIVEDSRGVIWAGGAAGFSRFIDGGWTRVGKELGYPAPGARQLLVDRRGTLWAATDQFDFGLNKKDSVRVNTILKLHAGASQFEPTGQPVGYVAQLAEAPDGAIWMAEASDPEPTVRRVDKPSSPLIEREAKGAPLCVVFDGAADMWFGLLRGGLRRLRDFRRLSQEGVERFANEDGLSSDGVRSALKDREGNLWFGTNRGVDRFRENKVTPLVAKDGLVTDSHMVLVSSGDGKTWVINTPLDVLQWFDKGRFAREKLPAYSASDSTRLLTAYSNGDNVWLGGSFGLARRRGGGFSFVSIPGSGTGTTVEAVTADVSGDLWIALWHGDRSTFKRLHDGTWTDYAGRPELPTIKCRVLYGDTQGRVWFGFATGEVWVREQDKFQRYTSADGLPPGKVLSVSSDSRGQIWVGGEGGLSQFRQGRFRTLTKENGLPGSAISALLEDSNGFLWIGGELGIARVDPNEIQKALATSSYRMNTMFLDTADGLPGLPAQEENYPAATKSPDGRLWFATTDGIAMIDPLHLPMNGIPPALTIQSVTAGDRFIPLADAIHFSPSDRNIEIGFAALSFSIPERVRYRYKLEGYDANWREPFSTRTAAYTNLPPRPYRFRVVASNNDGVWNTAGATLDFDIAPLFYETKWFLAACAAAALATSWLLYQWRLRFVTARLDLRYSERLSERERIARELHDTLLQSVQGLMLRFQSVAKAIPMHEPAKVALESALDRADDVMAEGRARVTSLRSFYGECPDLSEALSAVAKEFEGPVHPAFRVVIEGSPRSLHPLARDEVYRIGREAILNALKHSHSEDLEAELYYSAKELRLRVQDNGCGIDEEVLAVGGRASHWGLRGMTERAEKMGALLSIRSKPGAGTEVELKVPGVVAYRNRRKKLKKRSR